MALIYTVFDGDEIRNISYKELIHPNLLGCDVDKIIRNISYKELIHPNLLGCDVDKIIRNISYKELILERTRGSR